MDIAWVVETLKPYLLLIFFFNFLRSQAASDGNIGIIANFV